MIAELLREEVHRCNKCGACIGSCQVYKQLNYESASPRGKVQLIKRLLAGELELSEKMNRILFTCLLCESCTVTCPSGVQVDRLMKAVRSELFREYGGGWQKRGLFKLLASNRLLSLAMFFGRAVEDTVRSMLGADAALGTLAIRSLPRLNRKPLRDQFPEVVTVERPKGRVVYFTGCATNYLCENVGRSVITVLNRVGIEVVIPKDQMCCSLPIFLSGARELAITNIGKNLSILNRGDVDAVIVDCATCGAALKHDYPQMLEEMGEDAEAARSLAAKVKDISQYLAGFDLAGLLRPLPERVTYHDPCHLLRSQRVKEEPRALLRQIPGLEFREMAGADLCCGGGGSFQLQHPDIASGITARKIEAIRSSGATMVASGCTGCRLQIKSGLRDEPVPVVHPVELLARALR